MYVLVVFVLMVGFATKLVFADSLSTYEKLLVVVHAVSAGAILESQFNLDELGNKKIKFKK